MKTRLKVFKAQIDKQLAEIIASEKKGRLCRQHACGHQFICEVKSTEKCRDYL